MRITLASLISSALISAARTRLGIGSRHQPIAHRPNRFYFMPHLHWILQQRPFFSPLERTPSPFCPRHHNEGSIDQLPIELLHHPDCHHLRFHTNKTKL
ncbi:hypothetical protein V6N13_100356 [Hibiscus sabdariffa]